jgi:hypothetical protein
MKRLYKKTRHKVYKEALSIYKHHNYKDILPKYGDIGLCAVIVAALLRLGYLKCITKNSPLSPIEYMYKYPEIHKHKPIGCGLFWWPVDNKDIRIKILRQAIEETDSNS